MGNNVNPVGADPCVRPQNVFVTNQYIYHPKGQTHGSAPTQYKYNRRSLRLPHYDYSCAGYYFVTITAQNREHLFGEIVNGEMVLNVAGLMVEKWYGKLEEKFPNVKNHEMVIMPNHIHFIIEIMYSVGADPCVRPLDGEINMNTQNNIHAQGQIRGSKGQTHRSAPRTHTEHLPHG